jgi:hypothetical protein
LAIDLQEPAIDVDVRLARARRKVPVARPRTTTACAAEVSQLCSFETNQKARMTFVDSECRER